MGVKFATVSDGDSVVAIARNAEPDVDEESPEVGDADSEVESDGGSRETEQVADPSADGTTTDVDEEQPE
jgi:hypothetical protein